MSILSVVRFKPEITTGVLSVTNHAGYGRSGLTTGIVRLKGDTVAIGLGNSEGAAIHEAFTKAVRQRKNSAMKNERKYR